MHNHHDAHQKFPPGHPYAGDYYESSSGGVAVGGFVLVGGGHKFHQKSQECSWVTFLLPYIEQDNIYKQIVWNVNFGAPPNQNTVITSTQIPMFLCPSDGRGSDKSYQNYFAKGSYVANNGIGPFVEKQTSYPSNASTVVTAGPMGENSYTTISSITDGTSNTALVSEVRRSTGDDFRGNLHYPEGNFYHHNYRPNNLTADLLRAGFCVDQDFAPCATGHSNYADRNIRMTARSFHSGGVNVALCDGSIRFVNATISENTWKAVGTMSNQEVLGSDF